ncbi:phage tail protein [Vibrio ponticus]|uniref:phage tail protein n=1 Tax=Vibrio ponticus TaxID=265668 RepID=UPI0021A8B009|nr:phage tail protein [Vibrio ponticus]
MANTTDKSILTAAGKALLAQLNAEEKPLIIDKMIFANVPNRPEFPQPDDVVPTEHIVHQEGVEQRGRLSADSVIYSTTLTSSVGPFDFNWTGAYCSEYGVLVTIDHHALTPKTADQPGISGNTLVRSVVLEYKDIAEITNITVDASSWQYNAVPRMKKMDDDVAQAIIDQNGKDWFIEDGFLVTPQASAFNIKAGAGYVSGNRVMLEFDRSVQVPNKPSFIYVDARREGTPTGEQVTLFDFVVTAEEKDDYTDVNGAKHFVCKIAQVLDDGSVSDLRPEFNRSIFWRKGTVVTDSTITIFYKKKGEKKTEWYCPNASTENPVVMGDTPYSDDGFEQHTVDANSVSKFSLFSGGVYPAGPDKSLKEGSALKKWMEAVFIDGVLYPLSKSVNGEVVEIDVISKIPSLRTSSEVVYLLNYKYWDKTRSSAKTWWAVGDGVVDDTKSLEMAISWKTICRIEKPDESYKCLDAVHINESNKYIFGEGGSDTVLNFTNQTNGIQMGDGSGQYVRNISFQDLSIRGSKTISEFKTFGIVHKDSLDYPGGQTPQERYLCESVSLRNVWCWDFDVGMAHGLGAKVDFTNYQGIGCKRGLWSENSAGITYREVTLSGNEVGLYMVSCSHVTWTSGECNGNLHIAMNIVSSSGTFISCGFEINNGQVLRVTSPMGIKFIQSILRHNRHGNLTAIEVDAGAYNDDHSFKLDGLFLTRDESSNGKLITVSPNINSCILMDVDNENCVIENFAKKALNLNAGGIEISTKYGAVKISEDRVESRIVAAPTSITDLMSKIPDGKDIGMTRYCSDGVMQCNLTWDGYMWRNAGLRAAGTTAQRPEKPWTNFYYYDAEYGEYVHWDGATWQL